MGTGETTWIRISILSILCMLDSIFGDLAEAALRYWQTVVGPGLEKGILVGPTSGTNYTESPVFADRSVLALQLYFDAVVTSSNALGRAAVATRKYYVLSFRVSNVPFLLKQAEAIVPAAVVPPDAYDHIGFDGIIKALQQEFDELAAGVVIRESGHEIRAAVMSLHADNEAAQIAAGVTTSSGTHFCRQCNATRATMYSFPEYVLPFTLDR